MGNHHIYDSVRRKLQRILSASEKKEIINIREHLDSNDIEILNKLGINIEDRLYTCYEFDIIDGELIKYYLSDDMDEDEKKSLFHLMAQVFQGKNIIGF